MTREHTVTTLHDTTSRRDEMHQLRKRVFHDLLFSPVRGGRDTTCGNDPCNFASDLRETEGDEVRRGEGDSRCRHSRRVGDLYALAAPNDAKRLRARSGARRPIRDARPRAYAAQFSPLPNDP